MKTVNLCSCLVPNFDLYNKFSTSIVIRTKAPPLALLGSLSLAVLSLAFATPVEAVIVNVNGTNYELSTLRNTYNLRNFCTFQSNPWWNQGLSTAQTFAGALFNADPTPNGGLLGTIRFAYGISSGNVLTTTATSATTFQNSNASGTQTYALATLAPLPRFPLKAMPCP